MVVVASTVGQGTVSQKLFLLLSYGEKNLTSSLLFLDDKSKLFEALSHPKNEKTPTFYTSKYSEFAQNEWLISSSQSKISTPIKVEKQPPQFLTTTARFPMDMFLD